MQAPNLSMWARPLRRNAELTQSFLSTALYCTHISVGRVQITTEELTVARIHPDIEAVGEDLLGGGVGGEDLEAGKEEN